MVGLVAVAPAGRYHGSIVLVIPIPRAFPGLMAVGRYLPFVGEPFGVQAVTLYVVDSGR